MWCNVIWQICTDGLEQPAASITKTAGFWETAVHPTEYMALYPTRQLSLQNINLSVNICGENMAFHVVLDNWKFSKCTLTWFLNHCQLLHLDALCTFQFSYLHSSRFYSESEQHYPPSGALTAIIWKLSSAHFIPFSTQTVWYKTHSVSLLNK